MHHRLPAFLRADAAGTDPQRLDCTAAYRGLVGRWVIDIALMQGWMEQESSFNPFDQDEFLSITGMPRVSSEELKRMNGPGERLAHLNRLLREQRARLAASEIDPDTPLVRNSTLLAEMLGLTEAEQAIVCFVVLMRGIPEFEECLDGPYARFSPASLPEVLARLTGLGGQAIRTALRPDSTLRTAGLIRLEFQVPRRISRFAVMSKLPGVLLAAHANADDLIACFVKRAPRRTLQLADFPHLARDGELALDLLRGALRERTSGTNLLLYGPPGVGKTEYAGALATALGADLYEIDLADDDGDPMHGPDRLHAYALCQRLLAGLGNAILVFDEVEDVFEHDPFAALAGEERTQTPGKGWVNRMLEQNPVPALWISNQPKAIDKAYLRRFDYSIRFGIPPLSVRRIIARHHLGAWGEDEVAWLERIAGAERLTPAQLERAAKVARHAGNGDGARNRELILQVLDRSALLLDQQRAPVRSAIPTSYDLRFVNAEPEPARLIAALRRRPEGSFCFHGPAGTGKSELARHIADALERPLLVRRASDLLSKWLGDTEQRIAEMFEEARAQEAVLVLDEADSFLRSRSRAEHSWEVTQVNELLTQMEAHPGIFICTTNLMQSLDAASLRRFTWKLRFDWLSPNQRWALVLQEFARLGGDLADAAPWNEAVRGMERLTPGDVAAVVRQYDLWDETPDAAGFIGQVRREIEIKDEVAQQDDLANLRARPHHDVGASTIEEPIPSRRRYRADA